jgi:hypothetical protein
MNEDFFNVLVRDKETDEWEPTIFSRIRENSTHKYVTVSGNAWRNCIPYNEDLCFKDI